METGTDEARLSSVAKRAGKGWFGSVRKRVEAEIREHAEANPRLRRTRYPWVLRAIRSFLVDRSILALLVFYLSLDLFAVAAEVIILAHWPEVGSFWNSDVMKGLLKDSAGFLISAQVGLVGVAAVAIALVTLLFSQESNKSSVVELYYTESMSFELTRSGVALLVVLVLQIYWPLQFLAHMSGYGSAGLVFKVFLTGFHAVWLTVNFIVFGYFMISSLRFVMPSERASIRELWTARVILPAVLATSLTGYYLRLAAQMLSTKESDSEEHLVDIGRRPISQGAQEEIRRDFKKRFLLYDVRLVPLEWAMRTFRKRSLDPTVRPAPRQRRQGRNGTAIWISPSLGMPLEGSTVWCYRDGSTPLSRQEKWLISLATVFRRTTPRDDRLTATPAMILEELSGGVSEQIGERATGQFKRLWDEMVDYHRFLVEIHNYYDDQGNPMNLGQVGNGFIAPYQDWSRTYREPIRRAIELIGTNTDIVRRVVRLPYQLLPADATPVATPVVDDLLDTARLIVIFLGRWRSSLSEPSKGREAAIIRDYGQVVREFIGGWEDILRTHQYMFGLDEVSSIDAAEKWKRLRGTWQLLSRHLMNSIFCLASAVWDDDVLGADEYGDMVVKWFQTVRLQPSVDYFLRREWLILPDRRFLNWPQVEDSLGPIIKIRHELEPDAIFDEMLRQVFADSLIIASAVLLSWQQDGECLVKIPEMVLRLLNRTPRDPGNSRGYPDHRENVSNFRRILRALLRGSIGGSFIDARYGAYLDGLITLMANATERSSSIVPGRVYSSFGWPGRQSYQVQLVAMMVASVEAADRDVVVSELGDVASDIAYLSDGETSLRGIVHELESLLRTLDNANEIDELKRCAALVRPDVVFDISIPRLRDLLTGTLDTVEGQRALRLEKAPLDPGIMDDLRKRFERELDLLSRRLHWVRGVKSKRDPGGEVTEEKLKTIDKGNLTRPQISDPAMNFEETFTDVFGLSAGYRAAWNFFQRPMTPRPVAALDTPEFWKLVLELAAGMSDPGLMITQAQASETWNWYGVGDANPDFVGQIERDKERAGSGGLNIAYVMTADGVDLFVANIPEGHALLFSADALKSIVLTPNTDGTLIALDFKHEGDPRKGWLLATYAITFEWDDSPFIDFKVELPPEPTEPGDATGPT